MRESTDRLVNSVHKPLATTGSGHGLTGAGPSVAPPMKPPMKPLTKPLTPAGRRGRKVLKRFLYAQLALRQGFMIAIGREQPLVNFTVEADPPSVYFVYRIRAEVVDELGERLGLPAHLRPAPIRCLRDDEPEYLITLNVYRVSGLANGIRAEWSLFVGDTSGTARYLVFDARSSQTSMDPIAIITRASPVVHERRGSTIETRVGGGPTAFVSRIEMPPGDAAPRVHPAAEWATANDYIYWGNGICDRTYYDAGMIDPKQRAVPASHVTINDGTAWADLVETEPVHVLVFEEAIELVISPWENLDRIER